MFRKCFLLVVAVAALVWSCTGKTGPADQPAGAAVDDDSLNLVARVNEIYGTAIRHYNRVDSLMLGLIAPTGYHVDLDSMFCSADWNAWTARVRAYDDEHNSGRIGFFGADHWIMGQDWHDLSVSHVVVMSMTDTAAVASLLLHNCDEDILVTLEMVKQQGEWRIDNFIDNSSGFDWKKGMNEYISSSLTDDDGR